MNYEILTLDKKGKFLLDQTSFKYWNDESQEKNKAFNVVDLGFDKIEQSKKYKALFDQLVNIVDKYGISTVNANILSVASGTCWVESKWLKGGDFNSLTCVDISKHRIHKLAPFTMEHYGVKGDIKFLHGSVFEMNALKNKYDIILMSQAFHHMEEPIRLLRYLKELLSANGAIVIVGEHFFSSTIYYKQAVKHFIKYLINRKGYRQLRHFFPSWQDLFQPSYEKGDILWSLSEYDFLFKKSGFLCYHYDIHSSKLFQSFVLKNNNPPYSPNNQ